MLQNGYIRYEDNGNKTHRYSLRMCDVQALRKEMTNHPERFADLNGRFTAQRNKPPTPTAVLPQEEAKKLREYIAKCWSKHPDALPSKLAAELSGLTVGTYGFMDVDSFFLSLLLITLILSIIFITN